MSGVLGRLVGRGLGRSVRAEVWEAAGPSRRWAHPFRQPAWDFGKDRGVEGGLQDKTRYAEQNPEKWEHLDKVVWPPGFLGEDGEPLPGQVYHFWENVKYSERKMWQVCRLVEQRPVAEALLQCEQSHWKGCLIMAEILREAVEKGRKAGLEFPSELHVAHAEAQLSLIVKGRRKHGRVGRFGTVRYKYSNVFVRLQQGPPPPHRGRFAPKTGWDKAQDYLGDLRAREIKYPLL